MSNANTYRQRAADCLRLASGAAEFYVRNALLELAEDFNNTAADWSETNGRRARVRGPADPAALS